MTTIKISSQSEFFIAICKYDIHSFVTIGVKQGDEVAVLASIGKKMIDFHDMSACEFGCRFFFSKLRGKLEDEPFMFDSSFRLVNYKAFAIQYRHYLAFLQYIKNLSILRGAAYCPTVDNPFSLDWMLLDAYQPNVAESSVHYSDDKHSCISLNNSCRHSAMTLTQETVGSDLGAGVSASFLINLPLNAEFSEGKTVKYNSKTSISHFYILPPPPTAFQDMAPEKFKIMNKLYQRLDKIILMQETNPITVAKFEGLKRLYTGLTQDCDLSLVDVMSGIERWEEDNKALIAAHRKHHWFSFQTATQTLFSDLHREFAAIREKQALSMR